MLTLEQKSEIYCRVDHFINIASVEYHRTIEGPHVRFDKRGTCGGTADTSINELNFNAPLMLDNWDEYLNQVIPHEVAHLVKGAVYGTERKGELMRSHGTYWKRIMRTFGIEPDRTHKMDTSSVATKSPKRKHMYQCECCGKELVMSSVRHNKMLRGRANYRHTPCGDAGTLVHTSALGKMTTAEAMDKKIPGFIADAVKKPARKAPTKKASTAPKAGTKISQAFAIYKRYEGCTRQEMITYLVSEMASLHNVEITRQAAAGYFQNCKKRVA